MKNLKCCERKLEKEREKLNWMIDASMGTPIAGNNAILKQSRKVDRLIARVQREREKRKMKGKSMIIMSIGGTQWM